MARRYNITIDQGATFRRSFQWLDENSEPVDITDCHLRARIYMDARNEALALTLTDQAGHFTITSAADGEFDLEITDEVTDTLFWSTGSWRLDVLHPNDDITALREGKVTVRSRRGSATGPIGEDETVSLVSVGVQGPPGPLIGDATEDEHGLMSAADKVILNAIPDTYATSDQLADHLGDTSNPHEVTAAQVGAITQAQSDARYSALGHTHTASQITDFTSAVLAVVPAPSTNVLAFGNLANGTGWLHNNGSGTFVYSTPSKSDVGLGNVDNTSDANKPVSTAQQTALDLKANLASPAFTGNPTAPTQSSADVSTKLATTAYVDARLTSLIGGAPAALDTLIEIANQLATDESAVSALTVTVSGKLTKSSNLSDLTDVAAARSNLGHAFFTTAGPTAARVYTFPDAAATIARTDAGQTFTGTNAFGVITGTSLALTSTLAVRGITTLGDSSTTDGSIFNINKASGAGIFSVDTSANAVTLGAAGRLTWSTDANITRNAAGVLQIGTTAANALGSLLAASATFGSTVILGTTIDLPNNGGTGHVRNSVGSIDLTASSGSVLLSASTGLVQFGGTTNSFSAIGRDAVNGFTLQSAAGTATWNDASTANSGTVATRYLFGFAAPTLTSTGTAVTYSNAATLYIAGAPAAGTNVTIGNSYSLYVLNGTSYFNGATLNNTRLRMAGGNIDINQANNAYYMILAGTSLTGSNASTFVDISGTWNTSGVPTALKLNVTNTASGTGSLLMDLQSSSVSKFSITTLAQVLVGTATATRTDQGVYVEGSSGDKVLLIRSGTAILKLQTDGTNCYVGSQSNHSFQFLVNNGGIVTCSATALTFADSVNLAAGTATGTKLGTATGQKLAFWGANPVVQQVLATGGGATVDNVITALQTIGLFKQS